MTRPVLAAVHALDRLLAQPRTALAVFVPAGLTERAVERHYLDAFANRGCDVFEVGIPHSTAVLDGDAVQSAYQQALGRGTGITDVLRTVEHAASRCPVVVMSYWAPIQRHGPERLATSLATAGAAAVMVPDLPPETSRSWEQAATGAGLATPRFIPRTTTERQLPNLCAVASGWLYAPASHQPTGYQGPLDLDALSSFTHRLRATSPLPVACGVGISTPALAAAVAPLADAVVIGSPIVRALTTEPAHAPALVAEFAHAVHGTAAQDGSAGHLPRAFDPSSTSWKSP